MKRHCSVCNSVHHDKRFHKKKTRRNVDGFTSDGVFHPIRGSKGYDSASAGDSALTQAKTDWKSGRAYLDNHGNYHTRPLGQKDGHGPIASWNKAAKKAFKDSFGLHAAAHKNKGKRISVKKTGPGKWKVKHY